MSGGEMRKDVSAGMDVQAYAVNCAENMSSHFSSPPKDIFSLCRWVLSRNVLLLPMSYDSGIDGEGICPGKILLVVGTPEKKGKRLNISLLQKNGDIALHFSPRFDEKTIVRNRLLNNEGSNEEREGKIPIKKDVEPST